jgi:hypothetical protein
MSSRSGPVAAHNLVFSDGVVRLECAATGAVVAERVPGDDPARIGAALHGLAPHCEGPVVAVLPAEVFRAVEVPRGPAAPLVARLALARRALSRREDAERLPGAASLAAAFGFGPRALALATGPADRRGRVAVVAVERRTLKEAARFLAAHGIALAAVRPDPALLPGRVLPRLPLATARPARSRVQRAVAPGSWLAGSWVAGPWLAGLRARLAGLASRRAALAGGAAVAAVLAGALVLAGRDAPVAETPGPLVTLPDMPVLEAAADVAAPEVTAALPQPLAPKPRTLTGLELLTEEAPPRRPEAPAALAEVLAALDAPALASFGSRSVPPDVVADARRAAEAAQARADATRLAAVSPVPRPVAESMPASATASDPAGRPAPRPGDAGGAAAAGPSEPAAGPQASAGDPAAQRPQPRPLSEAEEVAQAVAAALAAAPPVQVAALDPAVSGATAGLAAAATAGPRPAPRQAAAVPAAVPAAAPQAARAPAPVAVRPAPQAAPRQMAALPQQAAPAAAAPRVQAPAVAPRTQAPAVAPQRAQPQPAQPQRQAARPPQPQPQVQRQQAQPQRQAAPAAAAGGSGNISLIGVFGASNQRHALVRLPNGSVQRVRPGETVAGAQVAAVGADNVRLRTNGGDRVLRLPD